MDTAGKDPGLPPEDAVAEGRTEPHVVLVKVGYDKSLPNRERRIVVWTRPGKARIHTWSALPPGRYEPLAVPTWMELQTIAVTDLATGEARLQHRAGKTLVVLPGEVDGVADRSTELRMYLEVVPVEE